MIKASSLFQDAEISEPSNPDLAAEPGPAPNGRIHANFLSPGRAEAFHSPPVHHAVQAQAVVDVEGTRFQNKTNRSCSSLTDPVLTRGQFLKEAT
jgi:hypothetical protein